VRASTVFVVVPAGIDDPAHPSGGNVYDRRVSHGLAGLGWAVAEQPVGAAWPTPEPEDTARLARVLAQIPDRAVVLLDGLIASSAAPVVLPESGRLRVVALVHMPLGTDAADRGVDGPALADVRRAERAVLAACRAVIATSSWSRELLLRQYALDAARLHVAEPGVAPASTAPGTAAGGELLCVAAVAPHKGHDVLLAALADVGDVAWRCVLVGPTDRDPAFVERLIGLAREAGLDERIEVAGPRTGAALDAAYAAADVLVLASRSETYGMVVTEALARGIPVIATAVGGVPETLGRGPYGEPPGLLVPPGDSGALAAALRRWLSDADLREDLRRAARRRRGTLPDWSVTVARVSDVLIGVAA
jgi:glycosyltransferase involved in cell wall biosynthesis